jgi:uncharacterized protein
MKITEEDEMNIDREEISRLTEEYGGSWGINHTRRLLKLIEIIGKDLAYDEDAIWLAAHLHDWGGYTPWAQEGVDHAMRSKQVAEQFLAEREFSIEWSKLVLECIELHHNGDAKKSLEAILLSDADALDFLGIVGMLRDFSKNTKDLRKAYEITRKRREKLPKMLRLEKSKELANERLEEMDQLYSRFEAETFGCY